MLVDIPFDLRRIGADLLRPVGTPRPTERCDRQSDGDGDNPKHRSPDHHSADLLGACAESLPAGPPVAAY